MNIVTAEPKGWVCGWLADTLAEKLGCEAQCATTKGTNLYVPYYLLQSKTDRDIALFTHRSVGEAWDLAADLADVCIAMSKKTATLLPPKKTVVLEPPADPQFRRNILIGVAGREYPDNRKGTQRIPEIEAMPGLEIIYTGGHWAWNDMRRFYQAIDYLVVLGDNEGGPMPVKEAIASGCPVIAPDVGWCWDYPVIRYEGMEGLESVLRRLTPRPDEWDIFASQVRSLCSA